MRRRDVEHTAPTANYVNHLADRAEAVAPRAQAIHGTKSRSVRLGDTVQAAGEYTPRINRQTTNPVALIPDDVSDIQVWSGLAVGGDVVMSWVWIDRGMH